MFRAITAGVLRQKKEQQMKQLPQQTAGSPSGGMRLRNDGAGAQHKKKKCC